MNSAVGGTTRAIGRPTEGSYQVLCQLFPLLRRKYRFSVARLPPAMAADTMPTAHPPSTAAMSQLRMVRELPVRTKQFMGFIECSC